MKNILSVYKLRLKIKCDLLSRPDSSSFAFSFSRFILLYTSFSERQILPLPPLSLSLIKLTQLNG